MIRESKRLRTYFWRPVWIGLPLYMALAATIHWLMLPPVRSWLMSFGIPDWLATVLYFLIYSLVAGTIFIAVLSATSSFFWDTLSAETEREVTGAPLRKTPSFWSQLVQVPGRFLFGILTAICMLISGIVPVVGPVMMGGWVTMIDATASPFALRGKKLRHQLGEVPQLPEFAMTLMLAGMFSLVPIINVLVLPFFVITGTLMVLSVEGRFNVAQALRDGSAVPLPPRNVAP